MIELKIVKFKDGKVAFYIEGQDLEDYARLHDEPFTLKLSDGFEYKLESCIYPSYGGKEVRELFVLCGNNRRSEYDTIRVGVSEYLNIFELVKKYNETFF